MSVEQQIQPQDFDFDFELDRGLEEEDSKASTSKVLEEDTCSLLAEAIGTWDQGAGCVGELSRNTSLTTVSSSFPLTARIESHHRWDNSQQKQQQSLESLECSESLESESLSQASAESRCKCQRQKDDIAVPKSIQNPMPFQ
ncbi:uncharacterized protein Dana_GF21862 [Drosophila ananassae]|uniref:Uncharacterized protein n=1 Tax=Drosophila ananassae TaxID=7217 RepID=B3N0J9_DROAN|nr:uncharacterized protein LOC6504532 [Drosophila ananassae]EDV38403.1 uncharacterized protein Dana_GF21862 [Drosophila ananassae]KAH8344607.1 hypothetical protein KR067_001220 [Drosophila pandora]